MFLNKLDFSMLKSGLNINLFSFSIPQDIINDTDDIRVSITSMPDKTKKYFYLQGKDLFSSNQTFGVNITNKTKEILIVFRRRDFLENDPIVASAIIHPTDLPNIPQNLNDLSTEKKETPRKKYPIFEPKHRFVEQNKSGEREVIGEMEIQMSLKPPYPETNESSNKNNSLFEIKKPSNDLFGSKEKNETKLGPKYNNYSDYILF